VFEVPFEVRNDYLWHTKQDVVDVIDRAGHGNLIARTVSCMHTRQTTQVSPHCGVCSQCISRRFATLGIQNATDDPSDLYRVDVMTGARKKTEERTIAERFLGLARKIEVTSSAARFYQSFAADLGRVTPFIDGATTDVIDNLFDLHKRHSQQVSEVIREAMKLHVDDLHHGKLPDSCPVMLAYRQAVSVSADANDCDTPSEYVESANDLTQFTPTHEEWIVLEVLADATQLMIQQEIAVASGDYGRRLGRKTVGSCLQNLHDQGLVAYPRGPRKGTAPTDLGRQLVNRKRAAHK